MFQSFILILGLEPENGFRCALPCDLENATFTSIQLNNSELFPRNAEDNDWDFCQPYAYHKNNSFTKTCTSADFHHDFDFENLKCEKVLYNDFSMRSTIVTDFNLICNKQYMVI